MKNNTINKIEQIMPTSTEDTMKNLIPVLSKKEKQEIFAYYTVYEKYEEEFSKKATEDLKDHPVFGKLIRDIPKEVSAARNKLSRELQKDAIMNDNWQPYIEYQIEQGITYAKMGLDFNSWYEVISLVRNYITPYLQKEYGIGAKLISSLNGMNRFLDIAMGIIGTAYVQEKKEIIKQGTTQKQSSQYARSLIEASLDPLVTISPEGKITDVNEATIKVTGVRRNELIGTDFSNYFTEPEKALEGYQQVFAKGFVTDYPLTIRHREGKLTDVLYNASVYKDVTGKVLGVFAAARDVTESKRVMSEFAETRNFLDNILQSSTKYSIIGKDLDHRILSWNEGGRRNYGYTAEEILGKNSEILHTPEDIKSGAVAKLLAASLENGLAEGEFERVRKDGSRFMASVVVTRRDDASGHPIGYLLMSNDISDKKQTEEQLRFASQYARSLIEASLDPLVTISPEGKITDVNEGSIKVTGIRREELIGADFSNYFTEPEKAREGYQQVFAKGFVTNYPLTIRHKDERLTDVLYNASVYKDVTGKVLGVFAAARDITAQKKAEHQLVEQREKDLDRLAELERFQKLTVGRELKMIELKKEIEELKRKLGE